MGGVCKGIFVSNPTTVLRLCCVVVRVLAGLNENIIISYFKVEVEVEDELGNLKWFK